MPNTAFEITTDDICLVMNHQLHRNLTDEEAEHILSQLDCDAVEKCALDGGTSLDEQTDAAYAEIQRQIKEKGL